MRTSLRTWNTCDLGPRVLKTHLPGLNRLQRLELSRPGFSFLSTRLRQRSNRLALHWLRGRSNFIGPRISWLEAGFQQHGLSLLEALEMRQLVGKPAPRPLRCG